MVELKAGRVAAEASLPLAVGQGELVGIVCLRVEELERDRILLVEAEEAVGAGDVVGVAASHPPGIEDAERRHLPDILAQAEDAAEGVLGERGLHRTLVGREEEIGDPVLVGEESQGRAAGLAGQLRSPKRVGHGPGEDGLDRRQEEVGAFEEERPFLGVEQGETAVDLELGDVGFDLGEVGIGRGVEDEVGGDAPFSGDAGLGVDLAPVERAVRISGQVHGVCPAGRERRIDLDIPAGRDPFESRQLIELAEDAVNVPGARVRRHAVPGVPGP